jgi:hypothetical protein
MEKDMFNIMCPITIFMQTAPGPPEDEKKCVDIACPGRTRVHYMTRRSHWMQKYKFGVTCPVVIFMEPP